MESGALSNAESQAVSPRSHCSLWRSGIHTRFAHIAANYRAFVRYSHRSDDSTDGGLSRRGGKGHSPRDQGLPRAELPGVAKKAIAFKNCRNVQLRDFSILQGGHMGILATAADNLTIDNLTLDTNRDGMDIDCCRNVKVSNCTVNSPWDDGICLKSSFSLGYARATEKSLSPTAA